MTSRDQLARENKVVFDVYANCDDGKRHDIEKYVVTFPSDVGSEKWNDCISSSRTLISMIDEMNCSVDLKGNLNAINHILNTQLKPQPKPQQQPQPQSNTLTKNFIVEVPEGTMKTDVVKERVDLGNGVSANMTIKKV